MANYLLSVIDPFGHFIQLTEACYINHILVEHPDLSDLEDIARTIETPDFITQDVIEPKRLVYYRIYRRNPQRWMIKVVVGEDEVVTAYRVARLKHGETILWQR